MKVPIWPWLRQSRSHLPSSIADDDERAQIYRAAMQQFEELMNASAVTGFASRPLPLFYAVSQAARAIIAVKGGRQPSAHGLSFPDLNVDSVLHAEVKPQQSGSFVELAHCVDSPNLKQPVAIGALMNSLPEFSDAIHPQLEDWPHALFVGPERDGEHAWMLAKDRRMVVGIVIEPFPSTLEEARSILKQYRALERVKWDLEIRHISGLQQVRTERGPGVWTLLQFAEGMSIDDVIPQYRKYESRWLRPSIVGYAAPDALLTWWALLFGLSNLARYYPVQWARSIDVDASRDTVILERVMTEALEAIPQLVLGVLFAEPILHLE